MRRGGRIRPFIQTRQWSGVSTKTQAINGTGSLWQDAVIISFDSLTASTTQLSATMKNLTFMGMSFSSDIGLPQVTNLAVPNTINTGSECVYVDSFTGGTSISRLNGALFLDLNEVGAGTTVELMPRRILYRRRFSIQVSTTATGVDFCIAATNAAFLTPGFGTDRTIRKRVRLGRQEALFYRWEIYNVVTTANTNVIGKSDFIGAVSYAFT